MGLDKEQPLCHDGSLLPSSGDSDTGASGRRNNRMVALPACHLHLHREPCADDGHVSKGARSEEGGRSMPLEKIKSAFGNHWPSVEAIFWIGIFGIAYIAMQKVMHPGWTIFGI